MAHVTSLLDIADIVQTVSVRGKDVGIYGISAEGFASLMSRFPQIEKALSGQTLNNKDILKMGPEVIGAFIAAGCGSIGDQKAEKVARGLPVAIQLDMAEAIVNLTFPGGFGPFVEKLWAIGEAVQGATRRLPSLPGQSRNSSQADTSGPGATPQDKSTVS